MEISHFTSPINLISLTSVSVLSSHNFCEIIVNGPSSAFPCVIKYHFQIMTVSRDLVSPFCHCFKIMDTYAMAYIILEARFF
jgi:hypothetical protein